MITLGYCDSDYSTDNNSDDCLAIAHQIVGIWDWLAGIHFLTEVRAHNFVRIVVAG